MQAIFAVKNAMAFFAQLLALQALLWILSRIVWKEQLRSARFRGRIAFATGFAFVGLTHLLFPEKLTYMVEFLPGASLLVLVSGLLEIALGILLLLPRYQRRAAWAIIVLLLLMFPANINVAVHNLPAPGGLPAEPWYVWSRLLFQPLYIAWVWWAALKK